MEYILINERKLKVTLEKEDLEEWDVSVDMLDYANPDAKQIFTDILQFAKRKFGFDTTGYKVLLQLFPSKDGGCEMFITCTSQEKSEDYIPDAAKISVGSLRAYSFDSLEHLIKVCKRLSSMGLGEDGSVWFDDSGKWYLTFYDDANSCALELLPINRLSFISEYGTPESSKALSLYLDEYATLLNVSHSVKQLSNL